MARRYLSFFLAVLLAPAFLAPNGRGRPRHLERGRRRAGGDAVDNVLKQVSRMNSQELERLVEDEQMPKFIQIPMVKQGCEWLIAIEKVIWGMMQVENLRRETLHIKTPMSKIDVCAADLEVLLRALEDKEHVEIG